MVNYDNKLGEWFKQVEERERELKAKKAAPETHPRVKTEVESSTGEARPLVRSAEIEDPAVEVPAATVATLEPDQAGADARTVEEEHHYAIREDTSESSSEKPRALFDEAELPLVEDFFAFMDRSGEPESVAEEPDESTGWSLAHLSEGTGEPRPISTSPEANAPPAAQPATVVEEKPTVERPRAQVTMEEALQVAPKPPAARRIQAEPRAEEASTQEKWDRLPHHLQTLFESEDKEVAQRSYKTFRENRGELIRRLLDPPISLEEAARILNVCPTTVRRYTNRGVLKHYRTAGNQRRFRLSDVLGFMEAGGRQGADAPAE